VDPAAVHPIVDGGAADAGEGHGELDRKEVGFLLAVVAVEAGRCERGHGVFLFDDTAGEADADANGESATALPPGKGMNSMPPAEGTICGYYSDVKIARE